MRLSIAIPVYNFAEYLPATLDSISEQARVGDVEIVIFDGGSTDNTEAVVDAFASRLPHLRYIRADARGGIDRDMAAAVTAASGDFVWLFSGDDIMRPGALAWALDHTADHWDVVLCRHFEWSTDYDRWYEYPVIDVQGDRVFDFGRAEHRQDYSALAQTSEAFFSFMGGLLLNRRSWESYGFPDGYDGTCWAHAVRLCRAIHEGKLTLKYTNVPKLYRRPDNDSFLTGGLVQRLRVGIEGYKAIAEGIFGVGTAEHGAIGRILREEFSVWQMLTGKFVAHLAPEKESADLNALLLRRVYSNWTPRDIRTRLFYARTTPEDFAYRNPERTAQLEALYGRKFVPRKPLPVVADKYKIAKKNLDNLGERAIAAISED